jgi:hypothetical protein
MRLSIEAKYRDLDVDLHPWYRYTWGVKYTSENAWCQFPIHQCAFPSVAIDSIEKQRYRNTRTNWEKGLECQTLAIENSTVNLLWTYSQWSSRWNKKIIN